MFQQIERQFMRSARPLYGHLVNLFESAIARGDLPSGSRLPPERELAQARTMAQAAQDIASGKKTLSEISRKKGISVEKIREELAAVEKSDTASCGLNFDKWEIDFLAEYVTNTHHGYVRENIPFISELAAKVARVHGDRHPELIGVADAFARIAQDLTLHMVKEEKILFPFIKQLVQIKKSGGKLEQSAVGPVSNPIRVMEMEHEQAGEDLEEIRTLTKNYTLPEDACNSYTILFRKLEEFEDDLHKHVHLENNILFPKAIAMEAELK